jgi:translation initiation factor 1
MSELSKFVASRNFKATLKLDTAGRKGKSVTVIGGLPKNELFLKEMTKQLKAKCGAGGTYDLAGKDGVVEIQGDHRDKIRVYLAAESIEVKG